MNPTDAAPADLGWGAFSDSPPWVLDRDAITWRRGVDELRAAARREVPLLTTPAKVPPGARVVTVVARLTAAVAPWLALKRAGRLPRPEMSRADISRRSRKAAEALGPTYIKLGQIISSGEGIFPEELVREFKLCRDQVPAESFDAVRDVVETDLGAPLAKRFSSFATEPLAAASIAQVHVATLLNGQEVVVKVQRPAVAT